MRLKKSGAFHVKSVGFVVWWIEVSSGLRVLIEIKIDARCNNSLSVSVLPTFAFNFSRMFCH